MMGVSSSIFTDAIRILTKRHGDRCVNQAGLNRLIEILTDLEAHWLSLPLNKPENETSGNPLTEGKPNEAPQP